MDDINYFKNIKNKYILKLIFDNLLQKNFLKIMRYNKALQIRLNKTLYDFKKESYKVEIEIIPKENKYGKFINLILKTYQDCYHAYFNNNTEEAKKNYITKEDKVSKIKLVLDYPFKNLNALFRGCKCIQKINFIKFNRPDIIDMNVMFRGCLSLEEINLSKLITANVKHMNGMFRGCLSLKEINFSNLTSNNPIEMDYMFHFCSSLKKVNLSNNNII